MPKGGSKKAIMPEIHNLSEGRPESQLIADVRACWSAHPTWSGQEVCDELQLGYGLLWSWARLDDDFREFYWARSGARHRASQDETGGIRKEAAMIWRDNWSLSTTEVAHMVGTTPANLSRWAKDGSDREFTEAYKDAMQSRIMAIRARVERAFLTQDNSLTGLHIGMASLLLSKYDTEARGSRTLELPEGTKSASITFEGTEGSPLNGGT